MTRSCKEPITKDNFNATKTTIPRKELLIFILGWGFIFLCGLGWGGFCQPCAHGEIPIITSRNVYSQLPLNGHLSIKVDTWSWSLQGGHRSPGGYSPTFWVGVCRTVLKTLTLFQTKMYDFSDLTPKTYRLPFAQYTTWSGLNVPGQCQNNKKNQWTCSLSKSYPISD